ncbi:MAG: polysaccharide biosynthesis C-terminal domain-containing protein [Oscillospiraceae bacterium]
MAALFIASSAMIAFAKLEIRLLASDAYFDAWQYVPVLCAAMLFCAFTSFLGSVYTVTQRSGLSFWTSLIGAAVNIALNALLIPSKLGIQGAAIATFASYFIVFLVRARSAQRLIPFRLFQGTLAAQYRRPGWADPLYQLPVAWLADRPEPSPFLALLIIDRRQLLELLYDLARKRKKQ